MELEARAVSCGTHHCYATCCPLTTEIVASQWPSPRDDVFLTCYLTPLILQWLDAIKIILPQQTYLHRISEMKLFEVLTFLLTTMLTGIPYKRYRWLAWIVLWHALPSLHRVLNHRGPVDLRKCSIFNTILMSPKSWLSQEDLDAGCEHSLVPMDPQGS